MGESSALPEQLLKLLLLMLRNNEILIHQPVDLINQHCASVMRQAELLQALIPLHL